LHCSDHERDDDKTATTSLIDAGLLHTETPNGISCAYRRFGNAAAGMPVVFLQHFRGNIDNWEGAPDWTAVARLRDISQPTLILQGDDIMIPTAASHTLAGLIPNAKITIYPDASHGSIFHYAVRGGQGDRVLPVGLTQHRGGHAWLVQSAGCRGPVRARRCRRAAPPCRPLSRPDREHDGRSGAFVRGNTDMTVQPNIVLVHGAWADGSCWSAVIERLQSRGYNVTAPQFPESSLAADVARLRQVLDRQDGPVIVAGHSYGGQIITALGTSAPNVVGLVYIAAFGLDEGESIGALLSQGPPTPALAHLDIDSHGFAWLPEDAFVEHFAADVDPVRARVMHAAQQPLAVSTLQDVMGVPAWRSRPCWYLVATDDQAIPPDAERHFAARMGATTIEVPASHVTMVSRPDEVAHLIETAAKTLQAGIRWSGR
jgi:pimeloyl-ACP methyl ester carboxylesterase